MITVNNQLKNLRRIMQKIKVPIKNYLNKKFLDLLIDRTTTTLKKAIY